MLGHRGSFGVPGKYQVPVHVHVRARVRSISAFPCLPGSVCVNTERPRWAFPAEDDSDCDYEVMLQHGADTPLDVERPRWVPPAEDDSDCDYEVMYHDHAMEPPPSAGLAAPGPSTPPQPSCTPHRGGV